MLMVVFRLSAVGKQKRLAARGEAREFDADATLAASTTPIHYARRLRAAADFFLRRTLGFS
jgi:hypothetical protein